MTRLAPSRSLPWVPTRGAVRPQMWSDPVDEGTYVVAGPEILCVDYAPDGRAKGQAREKAKGAAHAAMLATARPEIHLVTREPGTVDDDEFYFEVFVKSAGGPSAAGASIAIGLAEDNHAFFMGRSMTSSMASASMGRSMASSMMSISTEEPSTPSLKAKKSGVFRRGSLMSGFGSRSAAAKSEAEEPPSAADGPRRFYHYHSVKGAKFSALPRPAKQQGAACGPAFTTGDTVGCGWRPTGDIFFTLNGKLVGGVAFGDVHGSLVPAVEFDTPGTCLEISTGGEGERALKWTPPVRATPPPASPKRGAGGGDDVDPEDDTPRSKSKEHVEYWINVRPLAYLR